MPQIPLYFTKIRDVKSPTRAHETDAGIDFFVPNDQKILYVDPHQKAVIHLGIKTHFASDYVLLFLDKSGVALNKNLKVCGGVVDSGYTGELILQLQNYSMKPVVIEPGEKIVQALLMPVSTGIVKEWTNEDYDRLTASQERGANGHGSTGSF